MIEYTFLISIFITFIVIIIIHNLLFDNELPVKVKILTNESCQKCTYVLEIMKKNNFMVKNYDFFKTLNVMNKHDPEQLKSLEIAYTPVIYIKNNTTGNYELIDTKDFLDKYDKIKSE